MLCKILPGAVTAQGGAGQEASSRREGREKDTSPSRLWVGTQSPWATRSQNRVTVRQGGGVGGGQSRRDAGGLLSCKGNEQREEGSTLIPAFRS